MDLMFGPAGGRSRGQIALEFIIVYSLVLVIFLVLFGLVASQRAATLGAQQYASMQLVAQDVASYIDQALVAGSGYNSTLAIPASSTLQPYALYITSGGAVVANETIGKTVINAIAYSAARSLLINGTAVSTYNGIVTYSVPTYTGSLKLANMGGTVYVNVLPPRPATFAEHLNAEDVAETKVAQFNGASSYITTNYVQTAATSYTIVAWIRTTKGSLQTVVQDRGSGAGHSLTLGFNNCGAPSGGIFFADDLNGVIIGVSNATPLDNGAWYMVAGTFNAPSGTSISPSQFTLYINGKPASATGSCAVGSDTSPLTGLGGTVIGYHQAWNVYFNGSIADVQVYNSTLSAAQVSQLYREGINSGPIGNAKLVGWWPLDGNANDYSGNGNNGAPANINYGDVAQINARLSSISGIGSGNMPIGVVPDVGTPSPGYGVHTGSNGNATIFITSNALIGRANVTLTGYKYNSNLADNIVGWWPLDEGYGSKVYDASGNGNTGTFVNPSWTHFANKTALQVAQFNGVSSYIDVPSSASLTPTAKMSMFAWVYLNSASTALLEKKNDYGMKIGVQGLAAGDFSGYIWGTNGACSSYPFALSTGNWYLVGYTFNGTEVRDYVDGLPYCNVTYTGSIPATTDVLAFGGPNDNDGYVNGNLANVQIYNSSLSAAQAAQLYHEGISGMPLSNTGLVGWWPLDGNANDYLVYANGGTANSIVFSNAQIAIAATGSMPVANFNGVSSYVDAGNPASLQFSSGTTMVLSAWVKIINCNHAGAIIGHGTSSYILYYYPAAGGTCNINFASSNVANIGTGVPITTGAWHNVVVVNNIGTNVYIYIDGTQYGPYTFTNTYSYTEDLRIGDSQSDSGYFFNGSIADLQIYNTSLTQQQVQQLYAQGLPLYSKVNISLS